MMFKRIREAGILPTVSVVIGHPEESKEEFQKTADLLKKSAQYLKEDAPSVTPCSVIPGTKLHSKMKGYGAQPGEDEWIEWKIPGNDFNERKRRVKILNEIIKKNYDVDGAKTPDEEIYRFKE